MPARAGIDSVEQWLSPTWVRSASSSSGTAPGRPLVLLARRLDASLTAPHPFRRTVLKFDC